MLGLRPLELRVPLFIIASCAGLACTDGSVQGGGGGAGGASRADGAAGHDASGGSGGMAGQGGSGGSGGLGGSGGGAGQGGSGGSGGGVAGPAYYLSREGSDTGDGSFTQPWRSFDFAL